MNNKWESNIKFFLKKHIFLLCSVRIIKNLMHHIRLWMGNYHTDSGTTHNTLTVDESVTYIQNVFQDYKTYASLSHFYGKVCELGPGDNSGVALRMLEDGAKHVDLADRFYSRRDVTHHAKIYQILKETYPRIRDFLHHASLDQEETFPNLKRYYGKDASGEVFFKNRSYDIIVSRSVLEHTTEPLVILKNMYDALDPGGYLIHKVDLRDHALLTPEHHDLKFLEIPDLIYKGMTYGSGLPNRILVDRYRECAEKLDRHSKILITQLAYVGPIEPHMSMENIPIELKQRAIENMLRYKKKFANSFQNTANEDLVVSGFFLIIQKQS